MYRDKNSPEPFPFEIPGVTKVYYDYGAWHIELGKRTARATCFGGYSKTAPWVFSSDFVDGKTEWDIIGHLLPMHELHSQQARHVSIAAAYVQFLQYLGVEVSSQQSPVLLPEGGQATRLEHNQSTLIFHHKRPVAWHIIGDRALILGAGEVAWTPTTMPTSQNIAAAWGLPLPVETAPAVVDWLRTDTSDEDAEIPEPAQAPGGTISVAVVLGEDGEIMEFYDSEIPDNETLGVLGAWAMYTAL